MLISHMFMSRLYRKAEVGDYVYINGSKCVGNVRYVSYNWSKIQIEYFTFVSCMQPGYFSLNYDTFTNTDIEVTHRRKSK